MADPVARRPQPDQRRRRSRCAARHQAPAPDRRPQHDRPDQRDRHGDDQRHACGGQAPSETRRVDRPIGPEPPLSERTASTTSSSPGSNTCCAPSATAARCAGRRPGRPPAPTLPRPAVPPARRGRSARRRGRRPSPPPRRPSDGRRGGRPPSARRARPAPATSRPAGRAPCRRAPPSVRPVPRRPGCSRGTPTAGRDGAATMRHRGHPARLDRLDRHQRTRRQVDAGTGRDHPAGQLVSEHARQRAPGQRVWRRRHGGRAVEVLVDVAPAQPVVGHAQQHLTRAGDRLGQLVQAHVTRDRGSAALAPFDAMVARRARHWVKMTRSDIDAARDDVVDGGDRAARARSAGDRPPGAASARGLDPPADDRAHRDRRQRPLRQHLLVRRDPRRALLPRAAPAAGRARPGPNRDRFLLARATWRSACTRASPTSAYFPAAWLDDYTRLGSPLGDHPDMTKVPGIDFSSGSLGHGLSVGVGMALRRRLRGLGRPACSRCSATTSCNEGQVWEAAMAASHFGLGNLVAIVDRQRHGARRPGRRGDGGRADRRQVARLRLGRRASSTATTWRRSCAWVAHLPPPDVADGRRCSSPAP